MKYIINGPIRVSGEVTCSGAKNSALKVLSAAVLSKHGAIIDNLPTDINDVQCKIEMLRCLGCHVSQGISSAEIKTKTIDPLALRAYKGTSVRTSLLFLGALLGRFGEALIPLPGGCELGRGFDLHFFALEKLGAKCWLEDGFIRAETRGLVGNTVHFPKITTGGTENVIIAASMARGKTRIVNAHTRPEVLDLINFLKEMGACIEILGNGVIEIEGPFRPRPVRFKIIPDMVEAFTYATYAAISGGEIKIFHFPRESLIVPLEHFNAAGIQLVYQDDFAIVKAARTLGSFYVTTGPYPAISSEMQPLIAVLSLGSLGESRIMDLRFPNRFAYVDELRKIGAKIIRENNSLVIGGPQTLHSGTVVATDLRAGAALVGAALAVNGQVVVENFEQISRGYSNFLGKMRNINVSIHAEEGQERLSGI